MIQTLAASYFEFFPGDWLFFGIIGTVIYYFKSKDDDDFYG
jgi:hypothetical protein|tara:strand:+ start:1174 stop:1296 length:123 start_codon:yes stop_codon:yes gene_type:complete